MVLRIVFFALMALGLVGFGTVSVDFDTAAAASSCRGTPPPPRRSPCWLQHIRCSAGSLLKPEEI